MQRANLSREPGNAVADAVADSAGQKNIEHSRKLTLGVSSIRRQEDEPIQIAHQAEQIQLNHAKLRASRIVMPDSKSSLTYNEFRSLKRKLIPMTCDAETGDSSRNLVMITSALPGEGKTFTTLNLAIVLAAEPNLNVILVDGDVIQNSIAQYFQGEHQEGLIELLTGTRDNIADVLHPCADLPRLHVLFAGKNNETAPELLASRRMAGICTSLSRHFKRSIVLFDAPPLLAASEPAAMAAHVHHLIMLVSAGRTARRQVEAALDEVARCPSISLLFNRSPEWEQPRSGVYGYYGYSSNNFR
jgi:receptor protein-tyrosine kinase